MPNPDALASFQSSTKRSHGWFLSAPLLIALVVAGPALAAKNATSSVGLLVMAHGGDSTWNAAVEATIAPAPATMPAAIAFGMADRASLQAGVRKLEAAGVKRIAVVRLFISGESFLHQTEYLLGLRTDPPASFMDHPHGASATATPNVNASRMAQLPPASREPIESRVPIAISQQGLLDADGIAAVFAERARELSKDPKAESVLLLAHGMGEEDANQRLLTRLRAITTSIQKDHGYAAVNAETLREDWAEPRAQAEGRIRAWVTRETEAGRRVIVLPVRLFGFGPYRKVLEGLTYDASERGILPHAAVAAWIQEQVRELWGSAGSDTDKALR